MSDHPDMSSPLLEVRDLRLGFAAGKRLRTIGLRSHLPLPSSVMPRALLEKPAG